MKSTPMETVLENILEDSDNPLTFDELDDEIDAKVQEALRLLKAKGKLQDGRREKKMYLGTVELAGDSND